jgi:hypothetical protein
VELQYILLVKVQLADQAVAAVVVQVVHLLQVLVHHFKDLQVVLELMQPVVQAAAVVVLELLVALQQILHKQLEMVELV